MIETLILFLSLFAVNLELRKIDGGAGEANPIWRFFEKKNKNAIYLYPLMFVPIAYLEKQYLILETVFDIVFALELVIDTLGLSASKLGIVS
jgi:hypothetical protein